VEDAIVRYLGVLLPFLATLVCGHYILRTSGSIVLASTGLASRATLRRALVATAVAFVLIVAVDLVTDGRLFLRPRFPESQLLISILVVGLFLAYTLWRSVAPLARRLKRIA
jgi:hypothetical protein